MKNLAYEMKKEALRGIDNNRTVKVYKRSIEHFAYWAKEAYGLRNLEELKSLESFKRELEGSDKRTKDGKPMTVTTLVIQKYADFLTSERPDGKRLSPATVHTYLAGVCAGLGVKMDAIEKPARTARSVAKGRRPTALGRGKIEQGMERYQRVVGFAEATGLRRSEIGRSRADSLTTDACGYACVRVRGKGGKVQYQRLLPGDEAIVRAIIGDKKGEEKLFTREEMRNNIDFHRIRREHAQKAYSYYLTEIKAGKADQLRLELLKTWNRDHPKDAGNYKAQTERFAYEVYNDRPYFLRSDNAERARESGLPIRYNRLALMCTSVWHLAHWRVDVTVRHYMM